jgi:hypothetical protein
MTNEEIIYVTIIIAAILYFYRNFILEKLGFKIYTKKEGVADPTTQTSVQDPAIKPVYNGKTYSERLADSIMATTPELRKSHDQYMIDRKKYGVGVLIPEYEDKRMLNAGGLPPGFAFVQRPEKRSKVSVSADSTDEVHFASVDS